MKYQNPPLKNLVTLQGFSHGGFDKSRYVDIQRKLISSPFVLAVLVRSQTLVGNAL